MLAVPEGLTERVMVAVRQEAEAARAAAASAPAPAAGEPLGGANSPTAAKRPGKPVAPKDEPLRATLAPPKPRKRIKLPRPLVVTGLAAAMLVGLIGIAGLITFGLGLMQSHITFDGLVSSAHSQAEAPTIDFKPAASTAAPDAAGAAPGASQSTGLGSSAGSAPTVNHAPQFITVGGAVFAYAGAANDVSVASMREVGNTSTSLTDKNATPTTRKVYAAFSADTVYLTDDSGNVLSFTPVTRSYFGTTYQLNAAELTSFDQYPALPSQIANPPQDDGSPTFAYQGMDGSQKVYTLTTGGADKGIALPPKSEQQGPLYGNPNWTWWTPVQ